MREGTDKRTRVVWMGRTRITMYPKEVWSGDFDLVPLVRGYV